MTFTDTTHGASQMVLVVKNPHASAGDEEPVPGDGADQREEPDEETAVLPAELF